MVQNNWYNKYLVIYNSQNYKDTIKNRRGRDRIGSWMYNCPWNMCLSPLKLWVRTPLRRGVLDTTLCDKVCQLLASGLWFSPGTLVSSTNKTDRHEIAEILWKVALSTIKPKQAKPRDTITLVNQCSTIQCVFRNY